MSLSLDHLTTAVTPQEKQNAQKDSLSLRERDGRLLTELHDKNLEHQGYLSEETGLVFANDELGPLAQAKYSEQDLAALEEFLKQQGTLNVPVADGYSVLVDGTEQAVSVVAATEIADDRPNHGDMSSMVYLRDHIQAASTLMELSLQDPAQYAEEGATGHALLLSAMHLMSTPAQLARFDDVIKRGGEAGQEEWPHISLRFNDLAGETPNGWRNKQDSFQMLAYLALDAAEREFLDMDELQDGHKQFLGSIVPLLQSVGFPTYENSGSWEEIAANRTSVMTVETALLDKIKTLSQRDDFSFLKDEFEKTTDGDFAETVDAMRRDGLTEIGRRLPYESPEYDHASVKHRTADAALTYVLMYDLPRLLTEEHVPVGADAQGMNEQEIENLVLAELSSLMDPATNGIRRYEKDSYQRTNFHTDDVQATIKAIKDEVKQAAWRRGDEIDLDTKQALRDERTPQGSEAAWTHPLGQLSAWAASRSLQEVAKGNDEAASDYHRLSTDFLNRTLSTVTGDNQYHATLDDNGQYEVRPVPAYKLPECYIAYQPDGEPSFNVPSPHTPLNWSAAMAKEAVGLLRISTANMLSSRTA